MLARLQKGVRWGGGVLLAMAAGCAPLIEPDESHHAASQAGHVDQGDHLGVVAVHAPDRAALVQLLDAEGALWVEASVPLWQVGLMFDAPVLGALQWQAFEGDTALDVPAPIEVTWQEGEMHVARAVFPAAATQVRITGLQHATWAWVEGYDAVYARLDEPTAAQLPVETDGIPIALPPLAGEQRPDLSTTPPGAASAEGLPDDGTLGTVASAATIPSFIIPRSSWGARAPRSSCNSGHTPRVITIHHTVSPTPDSTATPQRMRGTQAYHMDSNGWCDIGYHFIIGHDGQPYQAFHDHTKYGIHVGGNNTNNVGISYMGTFTSVQPTNAMYESGGRVVRWLSDTYGIARNRQQIKGHREWNSTACPGNSLYPNLQRIIDLANGSVTPEPPAPTYNVDLDVRWLDLSNPWNGGSSAGLADAMPGQRFTAVVLLTNRSSTVLRGVELGYWIETPFLRAVNWRIETDHPAYDQTSWGPNSADTEPANPPRDGLGGTGRLVMHAFSVNETKRVVVELEAVAPSVGRADHPDLRAWVRNISDVYGVQEGFGTDPGTNRIGRNVRDYAEVDVLSVDHWLFDSTSNPQDTEGWETDDGAAIVVELGQLKQTGGGSLVSPPWTSVDANAWPYLSLQHSHSAGAHTLTVEWAAEGQPFDATRSARFALGVGGGQLLDLSAHPAWAGSIRRLRLTHGGTSASVFQLDTVAFQRSDGSGASGGVSVINSPPLQPEATAVPGEDVTFADVGGTDVGVGDTSLPDAPQEVGSDASPAVPDAPLVPDTGAPDVGAEELVPNDVTRDGNVRGAGSDVGTQRVAVNATGCSTAPVSAPGWALAFMALAGLVCRRQRVRG